MTKAVSTPSSRGRPSTMQLPGHESYDMEAIRSSKSRMDVAAIGEGRAGLLEKLVREQQAGIRAFIRMLGVQEASVDDLAQETFLIAYQKIELWDPTREAGPWLRGIARNLAANERRKSGRRDRLLQGGLGDLLIDRADLKQEPPATEWLDALRSCLQDLPQPGRELLVRRYADGELAEAMAARMRTKADALRQKLLRLRQIVKACIERKTGEAGK
jgi:RNA polymerase sigma-70 factor (ECF subfamily)